ncbi:hypothetical protein LXL04_001464 [Taraxacum kok-saghyz]
MPRFAVLQCSDDTDYVNKKYGGYFGVFLRLLADDGEFWDVFHVVDGDFPNDEQIGVYDGFVITGSRKDAFGNDDWIRQLLTLLNKVHLMKKKILGICFGHQILARVLGGRVARAVSGGDLGVRIINVSSSTHFFGNLKTPTTLSVIKCHQDEVHELPSDAEVLASSDKTRVEMFRYQDHIMGVQGHPEYTNDILMNLIDRFLQHRLMEVIQLLIASPNGVDILSRYAKKNVLMILFCVDEYVQESHAMEVRSKLAIEQPDTELWKKLCTSFLKGRL